MKLSNLLSQAQNVFQINLSQSQIAEIEIEDIAIDSRLVKRNSAFFALAGKTQDGSQFIEDAVAKGASLVVTSSDFSSPKIAVIKTSDVFLLLVDSLKKFYSPLPANIYAVTGTNGKTSTAEFTRQILEFLGKKSASIGTLGVNCGKDIMPQLHNSSLTTPDIVSLYKNLGILKKNGVDDVVMEVSSIGLEQGRIAGLKIGVGAFTNFTQDHLDYHQSMENYFKCKMILFDSVLESHGFAVLNSDIVEFPKIKKICAEKNHQVIEYGFKAQDLKLEKIEKTLEGQKVFFQFQQKKYQFDLAISGEFQVFNALCALGNILAKNNLRDDELKNLLTKFSDLKSAEGRMQKVAQLENGAQIFIDFAHSPDALENALNLARKLTLARVLVLFGCGGNRDAKKRPLMGAIASKLADVVVVTDDNPRHENPAEIRAEILATCDLSKVVEINDRRLAIAKAIGLLQKNDVLILAGKGHEKYQIIGDEKSEFDERKIVEEVVSHKL